jgi:hypothetical protein
MSHVARSQSQEAEWKLVSEKNPCPICNSSSSCHRDLEGTFACCERHPSDWPLTSGAWLHRVASARDVRVASARAGVLAGRAEHHVARSALAGSPR